MTTLSKRRVVDQVELNDHEKKNLQILDTIRKKGPIARAEISRLIGLNILQEAANFGLFLRRHAAMLVEFDGAVGHVAEEPVVLAGGQRAVGVTVIDAVVRCCGRTAA